MERLLSDASIVRHRGKIEAAIANARGDRHPARREAAARALLVVRACEAQVPRSTAHWQATTPESTALAKELRRAGFRFVGPTTVYAAMQACGVVNDHLGGCWVREAVEAERRSAFAT